MSWLATRKGPRALKIKLLRGNKSNCVVFGLIGLAFLLFTCFETKRSIADVAIVSNHYRSIVSYDSMHVCKKSHYRRNISNVSPTDKDIPDEVFLFIDKPLKSFHSDHWFHLGEHFVGWRAQIRLQIEQHCSENYRNHSDGNICLKGRLFKLVILADKASFIKHFTKMTLFMLLLSVSVHEATAFSHVSLYGPVKYRRRCLDKSADCYTFGRRVVTYSNDSGSGKYTFKFHHDNHYIDSIADYHIYNSRYKNDSVCNQVSVVNLKIGRKAKSSFLWFGKEINDTARFRDALNTICAGSSSDNIKMKEVKYLYYSSKIREERNVVLYDRNNNRKIFELGAVIDKLTHLLSSSATSNKLDYNVKLKVLVHDEDNDPCDVYRLLNSADLLLTPHGFQSTGILFMKPRASLLEIFPYRYYKESYQNLSKSLDITYHYLQNTKVTSYNRMNLYFVSQQHCMDSYKCRRHARGDHVHLTQSDVAEISKVIVNL